MELAPSNINYIRGVPSLNSTPTLPGFVSLAAIKTHDH